MEKEAIENIVIKLKKAIDIAMKKEKYVVALDMIAQCANLLYETNIVYYDEELEKQLQIIASKYKKDLDYKKSEKIIFYDGFGLDRRGLIQAYLNAICPKNDVVYVTYADRKKEIPAIQKLLNENHSIMEFVDRKKENKLGQIVQVANLIRKYKPKAFFFYSMPDDVVGVTILNIFEGILPRYQINLTDHAFWLGASCIDKCIEFRNYGASISSKYRFIDKNKIVLIPFYPYVNKEQPFLGFPFDKKENDKVIFSGGALYKTISEDNLFYKTIDNILGRETNTYFWYAGSGDSSRLEALMAKYPGRVFFTQERNDLYQLLCNCDVYYSTYPLCGGLMFQYAAIAGKVPVTLKDNEITDGFLINQKNLCVEFASTDDLENECIHLLTDEEYRKRRADEMRNAVISKERFDQLVNQLISNNANDLELDLYEINVGRFRRLYLDRVNKAEIDRYLVNKGTIKTMFFLMPIRVLRGTLRIARGRLHIR